MTKKEITITRLILAIFLLSCTVAFIITNHVGAAWAFGILAVLALVAND